LAFGNTCVVKTAETTPLAVSRFMELLTQAGVPAGVVNLVHGSGAVTGDALVRHPAVRVVSFTGGTETGRAIATAAGPGLKRVDLELGGKSANIVTASADLDLALDGALAGIYSNNGQQCFAGSRILLQRGIADQFVSRFVARARRIRVGDPMDARTDIGPLANAAHHRRVSAHVAAAVARRPRTAHRRWVPCRLRGRLLHRADRRARTPQPVAGLPRGDIWPGGGHSGV